MPSRPAAKPVEIPAAKELGIHMKGFLTSLDWWRLTPRFDDQRWFGPDKDTWYCLATIDADIYVLYRYNWTSTTSGVLRSMHDVAYDVSRFNPRTGTSLAVGTIRPQQDPQDGSLSWRIPPKPDAADWVLLAQALK